MRKGTTSPILSILECENILQPENAANIFIWTAVLFLESLCEIINMWKQTGTFYRLMDQDVT